MPLMRVDPDSTKEISIQFPEYFRSAQPPPTGCCKPRKTLGVYCTARTKETPALFRMQTRLEICTCSVRTMFRVVFTVYIVDVGGRVCAAGSADSCNLTTGPTELKPQIVSDGVSAARSILVPDMNDCLDARHLETATYVPMP